MKYRIAVLLLLLACPILMPAQMAVTSLRGTVTDPSAAVVPAAEVTLINTATGFQVSHTTDANGAYSFLQIPPGRYVIRVKKSGFAEQPKEAELLVSQPATINFSLTVQKTETTVEVSSEAPTLNTTDASIGNAADNATIQAFPWRAETYKTC